MFDGEGELVGVAAQVEVGVAPGMELGRAAQRLAGSQAAGALAGVVDQEDGETIIAAVPVNRREAGRPRR